MPPKAPPPVNSREPLAHHSPVTLTRLDARETDADLPHTLPPRPFALLYSVMPRRPGPF